MGISTECLGYCDQACEVRREYVELLCKTNGSFLRGASHPSEIVDQAFTLGYRAIGVCDFDGMYGMPKAYRAAKEIPPKQGFKLIVGASLAVGNSRKEIVRLSLIAKNRAGYGLICRMLTASHAGKQKGEAHLPWEDFLKLCERSSIESIFAIPDLVSHSREDYPWSKLKQVFGDRLFLPITRLLGGSDEKKREDATRALAGELGVGLIATNDVHYHVRYRRILQDALVAIREGVTLAKTGSKLFPNSERHLKCPKEMQALFADLPEAIANTARIANACEFCPSELRYRYPSEWIPSGETAQSYLRAQVEIGVVKRYPEGAPEAVSKQIAHELSMIEELGYADYFLTIWDIVEFARSKKILCQGRGSAANSIVCYCLGITAVDPVRMNLLFERFLSVERNEPPDIDVDFEHERREEVLQYVYEKYGRDRAAMVAAVISYRSRSSVRELTKILPDPAQKSLIDKLVNEIYGFPRHLSIHSGGFTLSRDPLEEIVPIEPARMEGRTIVQWDKDDLDALGLLKVDLLSLGMLSAIRKACDSAKLPFDKVPPEDKATYEMMKMGDTVGVFQIESRAQMNMLGRLQPENYYDLVIEVAIVRPGPIVGEMVHPYLKRRRGLEPIDIPHPKLEPILRKTLGVPLFQEQVMKMAIALGGFTPGEADELRRAIGAWRSSGAIDKMGRKLQAGLLKSGLPREFVDRVFKQIHGFSEYGFPESHAASFALLAYVSSYLKCHHPAHFTAALVNSQPMGFYSNHTLVDDAKRHGVKVLPVDPSISNWNCEVMEAGELRLGFRVMKGASEAEVMTAIEARNERPFTSLSDFLLRTKFSVRSLSALAMGDAFMSFGLTRRQALWKILSHAAYSAAQSKLESAEQLNLFSGAELLGRAQTEFPTMDALEEIQADYGVYRLSTLGHPMQLLREQVKKIPKHTTKHLRTLAHGTIAKIGGLLIVRQRPPTAKGTVFATIEDEDGLIDLIFHKNVYEKYDEFCDTHGLLLVRGEIQRDRNSTSLLVKRVESIVDEFSEDATEKAMPKARSWY